MALNAQQVIDRIAGKLGSPWMYGMDICEAGKPSTTVNGVATSFTASFDVLRRAKAAGRNLVITRERPFWSHENTTIEHSGGSTGPFRSALEKDPLFVEKKKFIEDNGMVVWRFRENWDARPADGQLAGLAKALGWEKGYKPKPGMTPWARTNNVFSIAPTTLDGAIKQIRASLKCNALRVIGDPALRVSTAALIHGFFLVPALSEALKDPSTDLIVCGEPVEWEAGPYFMDAVASGQKRAMVILGHEVSEEPGSGELAAWIKTFVTEVPVEHIPAGEPFLPVRVS